MCIILINFKVYLLKEVYLYIEKDLYFLKDNEINVISYNIIEI